MIVCGLLALIGVDWLFGLGAWRLAHAGRSGYLLPVPWRLRYPAGRNDPNHLPDENPGTNTKSIPWPRSSVVGPTIYGLSCPMNPYAYLWRRRSPQT